MECLLLQDYFVRDLLIDRCITACSPRSLVGAPLAQRARSGYRAEGSSKLLWTSSAVGHYVATSTVSCANNSVRQHRRKPQAASPDMRFLQRDISAAAWSEVLDPELAVRLEHYEASGIFLLLQDKRRCLEGLIVQVPRSLVGAPLAPRARSGYRAEGSQRCASGTCPPCQRPSALLPSSLIPGGIWLRFIMRLFFVYLSSSCMGGSFFL